jgi:hypothetical protein
MSYLAPIWLNALLVLTLGGYLLTIYLIGKRLRNEHRSTWEELGRPLARDLNAIFSSWNLLVYVLVRGRYHALADRYINSLIYVSRALFIAVLAVIVLVHQCGYQATVNFIP